MNETTFLSGMKWLWNHRPDIVFLIAFGLAVYWLKGEYDYFDKRLEKTETLCNNINDVQLPAIRGDIKGLRTDMYEMEQRIDKKFAAMDDRMKTIEAFMIKMDTYLTITAKDYPKGDPSKLMSP